MPRDHLLARDVAPRALSEVRVRQEGEDMIVDAFFADGRGDRLHLCFIGVKDLRIARLKIGERGYKLLDVRELAKPDRAVQLAPPKGRGASLFSRVVMAVD